MIAIKKVAATPLPQNEGKIVDSFNTTDDQTKIAPSARATKDYIDSRIISGTTPPSNNMGKDGDIYLQYA